MFARFILIISVVFLSVGWAWDGGWDAGEIPATVIKTNTDNFDGNLSVLDDTVQKALDKFDDFQGYDSSDAQSDTGWTKTGTNVHLTTSTDNVGIGSSSPIAHLDIDGSETVVTNVQRTSRFDFVRYRRAAGTWTDITAEAAISYGTVSGDILDATGDTFVIGRATPFSKIYIDIGTAMSSGGTFVWEYSLGGDTWSTLTVTDGTVSAGIPLAVDGVVSFTPPGDWATDTQNSQGPYYFVRLRVTGGAFTTEPTVYLVVPNDGTDTFQVMANNGDTIPSLRVDRNGSVSIGYTTPQAYRFAVTGNTLLSGTLSGLTTMSASSTITSSVASPNFTHVGGFLATGGSATALIPNQNSPVIRFTGQAWNGSTTRANAMDIYLNPDSEPVTNGRLSFKTTTVDAIADASELMNLSTDGKLSVLGRAQQADDMFDRVFSYIGTTYTDLTLLVSSFGSTTGDVLDVVGNYVYVGKKNKFSEMYFDFGTIMSSGTNRTWEYWNGSAWTALTVTDGTNNWQNDGSATFMAPVDWATTNVSTGNSLYWVRIGTASGTFTVEPTLRALLPNTTAITKEVLSNNEFDGATNWATTGDYAYTTDDFTFTYSSGSGTLRQLASNFNSPLEANTWYRFRYTVGVAAPSTTLCWIGDEVATGKTYFSGSTTEVDVFFKTNSAPGDFVIYTTATATSGFRLDAVYLKKLENGNIYASGDVRVDGIVRGNGTTGIKVDSTGNVGIGSLSPTEKLDVAGNIKASGTITGSNLSGTNTGDEDLSAYLQGTITSGYLPKSDGTKTFVDSSIYDNGNVGIGTSVPGAELDVVGGGSATLNINAVPGDIYGVGGTITEITEGTKTYKVHTFSSTGAATFTAPHPGRDIEYLVVGAGGGSQSSGGGYPISGGGGEVLTGTLLATSGESLSVFVGTGGGAGVAGQDSYFDSVTARGGKVGVYNTKGGDSGNGYAGATITSYPWGNAGGGAGASANLRYGGNGVASGITGTSTYYGGGGGGCANTGCTTGGPGLGKIGRGYGINESKNYEDAQAGVVILRYEINVTGSPNIKFLNTNTETWTIKSDGADSDKFKIGNGADRLVIDASGNVGLGTSAPLASLDTVGLGTTSATSNVILRNAVKTPLLTVLDTGYVGVGTSVPSAKLDLVGAGTTSATSALIIRDSAKNAKVTVLDNGNVGIGTSTPTSTLDVAGTVSILGSYDDSSYSDATVYQATSDISVCSYIVANNSGSDIYTTLVSDSSNPPTTQIFRVRAVQNAGMLNVNLNTACGDVKNGDYWKVTKTQAAGSGGTQSISTRKRGR